MEEKRELDIRLITTNRTAKATEGSLFVDGSFECYTLEDPVRDVKVPGDTAIPAGRYQVIINTSPRFKVKMPLLIDVPKFEGIRIHPGNSPRDTEGCILVGDDPTTPADAWIGQSRVAYERLFKKIQSALDAGKKVYITVVR